jgi:hypothetical protein
MRLAHALAAFAVAVAATRAAGAQAPMSADAAFSTRPVRLGFAGGVVVPRTGASFQKLKTGLQGQGFLLIQLPGLPALRANVDYAKMEFDRPQLNQGSTVDADRTVLDGVLALKLDLIKAGPIRPYVLAGVGAFNMKDVVSAATTGGAEQTYTSTNFGIDGGAGLAFKLGPITGFAETRLQNVYTKENGLVDTKSIQSFPVSFGIVF